MQDVLNILCGPDETMPPFFTQVHMANQFKKVDVELQIVDFGKF